MITDIEHWRRVGRGRDLQFFATDAEVHAWLKDTLPRRYAPYHLVGSDMIKEGRVYVEHPFRCEIDELLACRAGPERPRWKFWIWSEVLTPDLRLMSGQRINVICSYNGLVELQHWLMNRDRLDCSSVGLVDRVGNLESGEVRQHQGYLTVYQALRREIKEALRYTTIVRFKDGHEEEDDRIQLMTEAAARAYEAGIPYTRRPGRRVNDRS